MRIRLAVEFGRLWVIGPAKAYAIPLSKEEIDGPLSQKTLKAIGRRIGWLRS